MVRTRRLLAALMALLAVSGVIVGPQATVALADAAGQGGDLQTFPSVRTLLDTRTGAGGVTGVRGPASVTSFQVVGAPSMPTSGVSAVVVRVSVIAPTANTFVTAFTEGTTRPPVATVNLMKDQTLSNFAVVKPGASGKVSVYNYTGNTHIKVEAQGYFTTNTGSTMGGMMPIAHTRVIDTRTGIGTTPVAVPGKGTKRVKLAQGAVPVGASAIFGSMTIPSITPEGGYLTVQSGNSQLTMLDYENGINSSSGVLIPLDADGFATFVNSSSQPTHIIIDTHAYFTKTATAGAGYRHLHNRLYGVGTVPANSTVDVPVAGTNGMPTKGVAGAVLSFQATGTAAGTLRAWPAGEAEPTAVSETQWAANTTHRSSAIVKPGVDGKVRIRNVSSAAVSLYVDTEGWFSDPLPVIPPASNAPVAVTQAPNNGNQLGTLEYAYVNNVGQVVMGHQDNLDNSSTIQFQVISGQEQFTGRPSLNALADGTVQVSTQYGPGGEVYTSSQTARATPTWKPLTDLGGSMVAPPTAVTLSNGVSVQFAIDSDGKLWSYAQTGTYPFWRNLGDQDLTGSPTVVAVRDGVQIFARDTAGAVRTMSYHTDSTVTPWASLGGTGTGAPSIVVYPGYVLRVFAQAADGMIVSKKQDPVTGAFPDAWDPIGSFAVAGAPAAILDPQTGRTFVLARAADNIIYYSAETVAGSGAFGDWNFVNDSGHPAGSDPTVTPVNYGSSMKWIIVYRTINSTVVIYGQPDAAMTFAAPKELAPPK